MSFCSLHTQIEGRSHFFGCLTLGDELNDLALSWSEDALNGAIDLILWTEISIEHHLGNFGRKEGATLLESFYGSDQFQSCVGFQQESAGAGGKHFSHYLLGIVNRQDQDDGFGIHRQNLARGVQAVQVRHPDVEKEYVRVELAGGFHRLAAIPGLTANLPTRMIFKDGTNALPCDLVVIGDQDSEHSRASTFIEVC
jgi:hypothetical protein